MYIKVRKTVYIRIWK